MHIKQLRKQLGFSLCILLALTSVFSLPTATAQQSRRTVLGPARKVRLVVGIAIDQFRYDYLERFPKQPGRHRADLDCSAQAGET